MDSATNKQRRHVILVIGLVLANMAVWAKPISSEFWKVFYDPASGAIGPPVSISLQTLPRLPTHLVGDGERDTRLLYRDYREVYGYDFVPGNQEGPLCVGYSTAGAVDILGAVEVKAGYRDLPPPGRANAAWIYASSRELGGLSQRTNGSFVRLATRSLNEVGFLYNENFFLLGYDLTTNNYDQEWRHGIPAELVPMATNYVAGYFQLYTYEDVRDAISAGMPVIIGSSVGFGRTSGVIVRDQDGFLNEPMFRFRGKYWLHAMFFCGVCDTGRPGVLCQNSWGSNWVTGPKRFGDEPEGSFWIDKATVNKMVRQGDCFAIHSLRRL